MTRLKASASVILATVLASGCTAKGPAVAPSVPPSQPTSSSVSATSDPAAVISSYTAPALDSVDEADDDFEDDAWVDG